jgi:hypothetical protein
VVHETAIKTKLTKYNMDGLGEQHGLYTGKSYVAYFPLQRIIDKHGE